MCKKIQSQRSQKWVFSAQTVSIVIKIAQNKIVDQVIISNFGRTYLEVLYISTSSATRKMVRSKSFIKIQRHECLSTQCKKFRIVNKVRPIKMVLSKAFVCADP